MNFKLLSAIATGVLLTGATACTPDNPELPAQAVSPDDLIEGIAYSVTPDTDNPNIIHCKALVPDSYTVYWETPSGRSEARELDLELAFEGDYEVIFGVDTRAGLVLGEPYHFTITTFCDQFINDKAWTMLTGGNGNSKTWIYDNGTYGFAAGELSYGDPSQNVDLAFGNFVGNWDPGKDHCGEATMWESTMTFSLDGGANYEFYNSTSGETKKGKFQFDRNSYQITFTDAPLMHPDAWDGRKLDWTRGFQIIEFDENHLRIAYTRAPGSWGGEWIEVFNYVSKDYAESNTSVVVPVITLPDGWHEALTAEMRYATWMFDADVPYDWCGLDGARLNGFALPSQYPAGFTPVPSAYEDYKLNFNLETPGQYSAGDITGEYTLSADGKITLAGGVAPVSVGVPFAVDANNQLTILSLKIDDLGRVNEMWLGVPEYGLAGEMIDYIGYHFTATYGGGAKEKSYRSFIYYRDTDAWSFYGELGGQKIVEGADGEYTFTATLPASAKPEISLDFEGVLGKFPNFTATVTSIKMNGTAVTFTDSALDRKTSYDSYNDTDPAVAALHKMTGRIAILNPYNNEDPLIAYNDAFGAGGTFEITVNVKFDGGSVSFVQPE